MKKLLWLFPLSLLSMGAGECPLASPGANEAAESPSADPNTLNVGGAEGALWRVTFDPEILVTLRAGQETVSQPVPLGEGLMTIAGQSIDVANFCWRTDTICPHQVLPAETMIIQRTPSRQILIGFNRHGPLASLKLNGLAGQLDGRALSVPLAVGDATAGYCGLGQTSELIATAHPEEGDALNATSIEGRVALTYTGLCFNLGGSAAVENSLFLELSMKFTAARQPN